MRCEQIQERLSEYLEGLLDPENAEAVQSHLSSCSRCEAEAQALAQSIRTVGNLPTVEPPPGFSQKVMARIREEAQRPRLWERLLVPMRIKVPIHATALLLVAGLAVYLYQANRSTISMDQGRMPESVPFKSEPVPQRGFQSTAGERQKEMDEITESAAGREGALKRDENVPQQLLAKRKMSDLKSAKPAAPTAPAYELTFMPQKPFDEMDKLSPKLDALVKRSGGDYLQPESRADGMKQNSIRKPQIVWLLIPEVRYSSFKTELSALGKVESELKAESAPRAPHSSPEPSSVLLIKLTVRSAENP